MTDALNSSSAPSRPPSSRVTAQWAGEQLSGEVLTQHIQALDGICSQYTKPWPREPWGPERGKGVFGKKQQKDRRKQGGIADILLSSPPCMCTQSSRRLRKQASDVDPGRAPSMLMLMTHGVQSD